MSLPCTQRVVQFQRFGRPAQVRADYGVPDPSKLESGECLVEMEYAGVCHSDVHARDGDMSLKPTLPRIGGHEGVGKIVAIGAGTNASPVRVGDRVGLKFLARTCLQCESCREGSGIGCGSCTVHGFTVDGTFAQYAVAWTDHVIPIPELLDSAAAAPYLCAGVTVYKALKLTNPRVGDWIAIAGAGGGLGHLAVQYAVQMGLRVIAIDRGEEKRKLCLSLGAEKWIDFVASNDNLVAEVVAAADGKGPHTALVTAESVVAYAEAVGYLRLGGTLVAVGVPSSNLVIPFEKLVGKELKIIGTAIGSRQDTIEALDFAAQGKVKCQYSVRNIEDLNSVLDELKEGDVTGRVVIKLSDHAMMQNA